MPYPERKEYTACCKADVMEQKFSTFSFYQCAKCKEEVDKYGNRLRKADRVVDERPQGLDVSDIQAWFDAATGESGIGDPSPKWDGTFMVGDSIRHILTGGVYTVTGIDHNSGIWFGLNGIGVFQQDINEMLTYFKVIERNGVKFED